MPPLSTGRISTPAPARRGWCERPAGREPQPHEGACRPIGQGPVPAGSGQHADDLEQVVGGDAGV